MPTIRARYLIPLFVAGIMLVAVGIAAGYAAETVGPSHQLVVLGLGFLGIPCWIGAAACFLLAGANSFRLVARPKRGAKGGFEVDPPVRRGRI